MQALQSLKSGIASLGHSIVQTGKDVAAFGRTAPAEGGGRKARPTKKAAAKKAAGAKKAAKKR